MKRIVLISMAAAAAMLLSFSCQKEEQTGDNPGKGKILTVTASIGDVVSDTKTYIDGTETSPKTYWSEGDSIKLFDESGVYAIYCLQAGEGTSIATFECVEGSVSSCACAYYPANGAESYADGNITAHIPSAQKYVSADAGKNAGTFANGASPMVGTGTLDDAKGNLNLTFKNLFGVLQLTFKSDATITSVSRIDVASAADTAFYGTLTVSPQETEEGEPSCDFESPDQSWRQVSLVMDSPITLDATDGTSFYIVLPAGVNTARIGVTTNAGLYYKDVTKSVERSHIKPLAASTISAPSFTKAEYSEATDSAAVMVEGMIWAPVNCGYVKDNYNYGKLYQWGRKAGRGYNNGTTYTEPILQTATEAKFNSTTGINDSLNVAGFNNWFYSYGSAPNDWYANDASKQLKSWPMKSGDDDYVEGKIANPCPDGWRVPTYAELDALTGNGGTEGIGSAGWDSANKGYWFNGTKSPKSGEGLFLPAAGYCDYYGGANSRGFYGEYWSSSVDGSDARYMEIYDANAYMTSYNRAYGFSVRCVLE